MGIAKRPPNINVTIATKVVKFVVGKRKSVDVWRTSRSPKKSLGAKPVLKRVVAKWPPKCRVVWVSGKVLRA